MRFNCQKVRISNRFWWYFGWWESYMTPRQPTGVRRRGWGFLQGVLPASIGRQGVINGSQLHCNALFFIAIQIRVKCL
jgi:hypothetical protein